MSTVCAVVVTHNRRELLRECLAALAAQTRPPDRVLVVDNASTDGTTEMLASEHPSAEVLALPENRGGAGGFRAGMERAHAAGPDWLWLMDDDTIPEPEALGELLAGRERLDGARPPAFLASKVVWRDGRMHPMNAPWPDRSRAGEAIDAAGRALMPVRFATFASLLVHRGAVDRHGLPLEEYFVWSDDVEYTSRLLLAGEEGYLVPGSVALHKTADPHSVATAPPERFYFHVRNTVWMARAPGRPARDRLARAWVLLSTGARYLLKRPAGAGAVLRGLRDGLRTPPPRP